MGEDEFASFFRQERRDAILLHRPYPPHRAPATNSKFGGLPRLPAGYAWPRTPAGMPLHFLAQIDCADLPFTGQLPERGVLFFFGRDDEEQVWQLERPLEESCRVIHAADATPATAPRQPPEDLPPIGGSYNPARAWRGFLREGEAGPRLHVEWPIEPLAMDGWPDAPPDVATPEPPGLGARLASIFTRAPAPDWRAEDARHRRYADALGERREHAFARATGTAVPDLAATVGQDREAARTIFFHSETGAAAFPQHWRTIHYAALNLLRQLAVNPYPDAALVARLPAEAEAWLGRAAGRDLDSIVREEDRAAFRAWLLSVRLAGEEAPLSREAGRLVFASAAATIRSWAGDRERAALIAPHIYDAMAFNFSAFTLSGLQASQMLGHAATVQEPVHADASTVCLLNLASDQALGWQWGDVGYCSFWIGRDDLVARDFSRAWGTIEGG